ncbi:TPA: rod shape-determining protein [Candidatus Saccharibacteria bacterium]|nr:rod shape-determining protein [Candidatus Saccharibacteria bacterium]HIO87227.1 rod shape-determining protein [Candidatus Saccharibacteria bacterium]
MVARDFGRYVAHDIGIDLGTANTLVTVKGHGIIINEPSVVAIHKSTKKVVAIGERAKKMIGKTPDDILAARPLVDGVVSDFEITEQMLKYFVDKVHQLQRVAWNRPRIVVGLPSGVTEVEKRAVEEAARSAGARKSYLIEEPMAAAIGVGLPVKEAEGSMIVDIGGGTTEVAVMSLGGIVVSRSLRIAGDELSEVIMRLVREDFNLHIGETTAERIKIEIGAVHHDQDRKSMEVRGRNILSGLPQSINLSTENVRMALSKEVRPIVEAVRTTLEESPPELVADIYKNGIVLAGGGALLRGLANQIEYETRVKTRAADNALTAVVEGCGLVLNELDSLKEVLVRSEY